jgi:hypothetical protein
LIDQFNRECDAGRFPAGELNDRRVNAVREAITAIETAEGQPDPHTKTGESNR